ncbi:MAG: ABC transporter ATP-binding protein [Acidimicrobiales bacterium]|jgi:ATP-binding cassette subfamily B protein
MSMGGHGMGMGGVGGQFGSVMRSMRRDESVKGQHVTKGTSRRMFRFARPYRTILAWFLVLVTVDAVIGIINPLLFRSIINNLTGHDPSKHLVITLSVVAALVAVADTGLTIGIRWVSAKVGEGLIYDMRAQVFEHIQKMPIAFFTRTQTGALISRLNNDVIGAQQAFTDTLSSVVSNLISVTLVLIVMFILSWQITLISLVILPIFVIPAKRVGRKLSVITRESYAINAEMNNTMNERFNVSGALLVKLFGRPDEERHAFESKAGRVRDIGVTQAMYARFFIAALSLTAALATAVVYGWGGVQAIDKALTVGTVVALASYLTRLYAPLTSLSNVQIDVMTALVSFDRVFEVLDLPPMIVDSPDARPVPRGPATIEFDHVDFRYPTAEEVSLASLESVAVLETTVSNQVLFDVTFTVQPGQMVALVGPSGAGKTTISQLLPRLYDVRSGAIRINGLDIRQATLGSLAATVGVVTQDAHLFHETIRANLLYARPDATEGELASALAGAQIATLVESLPDGLDTVVGDRGYRLSGGEKQRLAIARLLLKAPEIVVLDEATAHLDSESEAAVQLALATALQGRTSLVIAHRLSTVREADMILVLDHGRIVERGRHEDLLTAGGQYADLYRIQFEGQDADSGGTRPEEVR